MEQNHSNTARNRRWGAPRLGQKDIEKVIDAVARDDLPHTEGFFFGVSDGSEKEETLAILNAYRTT